MSDNKERKSNIVTVRVSETDMEIIDYLSDHTNRSKSDTILRACKFGMYAGDIYSKVNETEKWGKDKKQKQLHLRLTDPDKKLFDTHSQEVGKSMSQIVRASIRAYKDSLKDCY